MKLLIYIGAAGFAGAVARYIFSGCVHSLLGDGFPFGTLAVNVAGSLLLGFIYTFSVDRSVLSPEVRTAVSVGFLGSLTTFSTFSLETYHLMSEGSPLLSVANMAVNLVLSLSAVVFGVSLAKML